MFYKAIRINNSSYYKNKNGEKTDQLESLNRINILVGQNNSGKSRFLRGLFSGKFGFRNEKSEKVETFLKRLKKEIGDMIENQYGMINQATQQVRHGLNTLPNGEYFELDQGLPAAIGSLKDAINRLKNETGHSTNSISHSSVGKELEKLFDKISLELGFSEDDLDYTIHNKIIYIPLLRGLKNPIKNEQKDYYKERAEADYSKELPKGCEIFTGLQLYEEITNLRLGNKDQRDSVAGFEKFLSKKFFGENPVDIVPVKSENNDVINVNDYPVYNLGDGIQTIILMTFPLFKNKDENLVLLIEEPEFGLHPGMQRILLETFSKGIEDGKGKVQIFFTTHSNHFLDISLEDSISDNISIYQFKESLEDLRIKEITNTSQDKDLLDLLGVRNGSVFLSNCIIWVEGISDRIYIKKILDLYQKQEGEKSFIEDKHYAILEYGGGNMTHFEFDENDTDLSKINVKSISKKNFLIADNDGDNAVAGKKARLEEISIHFGENRENIYSDMPEIENLITYEIYQKYIEEYYSTKVKNWKPKKEMAQKDLFEEMKKTKDIGKVLRDVFIDVKVGKEDVEDITILGDKKTIAERMVKFMETYNDLSDEAKVLAEKIYHFLELNNS